METEYLGEKRWQCAESKCSSDFRGHVGWALQISHHYPRKPANHSTRNCSWTLRIQADGQKGPAPRAPNRPSYRPNAPLSGANATLVNHGAPRPAPAKPVNMVDMGGNQDNPGPSQQGATRVTVTGKPTRVMWCSFLSPMTRKVNSREPRR